MMSRPMFRSPKMPLLPLLAASLCAACQPSGAEPQEAAAARARSLPALHVQLDWENLLAGRHVSREDYQLRLRTCEEAGMAVTPLSAEEAARLDTGTVEIRIDGQQQVVRQKAWTLGFDDNDPGVAGSCRFRLVEDADETLAGYEGIEFAPLDAAERHLPDGWTALGEGSIGGQSCTRWRKSADLGPPEEVCVWSGGRKWGFDDGPVSALGCDGIAIGGYFTAIPLQATPLDGNGCVVKLRTFSVGAGRQGGRTGGAS